MMHILPAESGIKDNGENFRMKKGVFMQTTLLRKKGEFLSKEIIRKPLQHKGSKNFL